MIDLYQLRLFLIVLKMFEDLVSKNIIPLFKKILCDNQHGFRKNHSTNTNSNTFYQNILQCASEGYQADVIYTNFAKVIDKIIHLILSQKLNYTGINKMYVIVMDYFIYTFINSINSFIDFK